MSYEKVETLACKTCSWYADCKQFLFRNSAYEEKCIILWSS